MVHLSRAGSARSWMDKKWACLFLTPTTGGSFEGRYVLIGFSLGVPMHWRRSWWVSGVLHWRACMCVNTSGHLFTDKGSVNVKPPGNGEVIVFKWERSLSVSDAALHLDLLFIESCCAAASSYCFKKGLKKWMTREDIGGSDEAIITRLIDWLFIVMHIRCPTLMD